MEETPPQEDVLLKRYGFLLEDEPPEELVDKTTAPLKPMLLTHWLQGSLSKRINMYCARCMPVWPDGPITLRQWWTDLDIFLARFPKGSDHVSS